MIDTFLVPFDYDAFVRRPAAATALRRSVAAIETARGDDMSVAYRVHHRRDLGPGRHLVLRFRGRLWWLLVDRALIVATRDACDLLRELRAGDSDLSSDQVTYRIIAGATLSATTVTRLSPPFVTTPRTF